MKQLWSPWRSQHIERVVEQPLSRPGEPSLFVRLAAENRDEENLILWRGQHVFVIMNLYPYNNGHLMIVPYRQVADYEALTPEEQCEMAQTVARCIRWLKYALKPDGFNVGMNIGKVAAPASRTTCTCTWCPAGKATRISCPHWPKRR